MVVGLRPGQVAVTTDYSELPLGTHHMVGPFQFKAAVWRSDDDMLVFLHDGGSIRFVRRHYRWEVLERL